MALNILLVDDSDIIRAMISRTLALSGLDLGEMFQASNGREALEVLERQWVDLVLADLNMPVMDGVEMIDAMRAKPELASVPVVVVSTEGATQRIDDLSAKGVAAWVRKPFTPEEIRDVVAGVTESWAAHPEAELALDHVFGHVIETFAYVFPESARPATFDAESSMVCGEIGFSGAVTGTLTIAAPAALCAEMAANLMAVDPADATAVERGPDTLAELVNITAGHLCTRLEPHAPTRLQPPTVARMPADEWSTFASTERSRLYRVEEYPVALQLSLRARTLAG